MGPDDVRRFFSRGRAPEIVEAMVAALERSPDWRRLGIQPCACGCQTFRAVFEHLPSAQFVGLQVDRGQGHGEQRVESMVSDTAVSLRRWSAWSWSGCP